MSVAIAPRFKEEDLKRIDALRGEATRTTFCYFAVKSQLNLLEAPVTPKKQKTKKPQPLRHSCGTKLKILVAGGETFYICPKCHTSEKQVHTLVAEEQKEAVER